MPGFLETTLHQGYDYVSPFVSPYVEKAQPYVQKVRNNVPLVDPALKRTFDPALKKAEELVPVLMKRADELAEPHVEKMRPYVEPKLEQVKEKLTPYVDEGVKKYGCLREEGGKYYNLGLEKVEQVKEFKAAKVEKVKELKAAKVEQVKEFKAAKVEQVKEFKDSKQNQLRELAEPLVLHLKAKFLRVKWDFNSLLNWYKAKGEPLKAKTEEKAKQLHAQAVNKLAPAVQVLKKTTLFKKVVQVAVLGSEKMLGKEKTTSLLSKAETYIPQAFQAAPPPDAKKD